LWNASGGVAYSQNATINQSNATVNFTTQNITDGQYTWNCEASDDQNNTAQGLTRRTVRFDSTAPQLTIVSPADGTTNTSTTLITIYFNASDNNELYGCNLTKNTAIIAGKTTVNGSNGFFTAQFNNGNHTWAVSCTDMAGNTNTSVTRNLTVAYYPPSSTDTPTNSTNGGNGGSGGSGGGSGGGSSGDSGDEEEEEHVPTTYTLSASETYTGQNYILGALDEVKFKVLSNGTEKENTLVIDALGQHTARLIFLEKKMKATMIEGEEKSFAIENTDNDLTIKVNTIGGGKVDLNIKSLTEPVTTQEETTDTTSPTTGNAINEEVAEEETTTSNLSGLVAGIKNNASYAIILGAILAICILYFIVRKFMVAKGGEERIIMSSKPKEEAGKNSPDRAKPNNAKGKEFLDKKLDDMEKKK
jgi:hypothetical protein